MCYTPAVKIFDTIPQAWIACTCTHLRNFLTYFPSFYMTLCSQWRRAKEAVTVMARSQSVSTPNLYVIPSLYHPFCMSTGSQQLRLYNRHPCWLYILYTLHVFLGLLSEKTLILIYSCSSRLAVAWFDHPTCGCHADILCLCIPL